VFSKFSTGSATTDQVFKADGSGSGSFQAESASKHYRKGLLMKSGTTAATDVKVTPGVVEIGGVVLTSVADINVDISVGANYLNGSEPADGPVYVYGYDNSSSLGIKLSDEPPDLSYTDDTVAEFPLRYQKYTTVYYRLLGIVHNRTNIQLDMFTHFDATNFATGSFVGDAADEVVYVGWSPDVIQWMVSSDSTPANAEGVTNWGWVQRYGFVTANPQPQALYYDLKIAAIPDQITSANGTVNSIYDINLQTITQSGSFTFDAVSTGVVLMWMAWSNGFHG